MSAKVTAIEHCIQLLGNISDRLRFLQPSVLSLLNSLCEAKSFNSLTFLGRCREYILGGMSFPDSWRQSALESSLELGRAEAEIVAGLSEVLGRADLDSQISGISYARELLFAKLEEARERLNKYSKLYKTIGVLSGIGLVIILA